MKKVTIERIEGSHFIVEYIKSSPKLYQESNGAESSETVKRVFRSWKALETFLKRYFGLIRTLKGKELF